MPDRIIVLDLRRYNSATFIYARFARNKVFPGSVSISILASSPEAHGRFRIHTSHTWHPRPGPPAPDSGVQVSVSLPPAVAAAGMSYSIGSNGFARNP